MQHDILDGSQKIWLLAKFSFVFLVKIPFLLQSLTNFSHDK